MTGNHPCPNRNCKNYGYQCWDHCNHCGKDILWKPKGMDWGVKYTGPKPLNPDDGKKHECMRGGTKDGNWYHTPTKAEERKADSDPIVAGIRYSKEQKMWPRWVIRHNRRCLELRRENEENDECDNLDCPCHWIHGLKNRDLKAESDRKHREWMEKWESQPLSFERFK